MRGYWRKFEIYSKKGWLCMPEVSLRGGTFVAKVPKTGGISGYPPKPPSTVGG